MKSLITPLLLVLVIGCSGTRHLEMAPNADLSTLPSNAQCWLLDLEDVCISLAENEGFNNTDQLQEDIKRAAMLLKELTDEEANDSWYTTLSESQSDHLHELILAMVIHYGVKHFVDVSS